MKIIFRLLLMVSLSVAYLGSNAQSLIIKGGLNMSNMKENDDNATYSNGYKTKAGFNAGIAAELPFLGGLSLEPGIMFATKGFNFGSVDGYRKLNYIDVPVNLKYKIGIGNFSVWISGGLYAGVGINGKAQVTSGTGAKMESDIKFGKNNDYKMLDYGYIFGGGVGYHRIILGFYYSAGLANISNIKLANHTTTNKVFTLSLGYRIVGE